MFDLDDYMDNQVERLDAQKTVTNLNMLFDEINKSIASRRNTCSINLHWILTDDQLEALSERGIQLIDHYPLNSSCYTFKF